MLRNRVLTALVLGAAFLAALYLLPEAGWGMFVLAFILVGAHEWSKLVGYAAPARLLFLGSTLAGGLLLVPAAASLDAARLWLTTLLLAGAAAFWVLVVPFWLARRDRLQPTWRAGIVGWIVLLAPLAALIQLRRVGPEIVLAVMATVWLADSAAYYFGKRYGQRKLAPRISPGKTWAGVWGALGSVAVFALLVCVATGWSLWFVAGGLAIAVLSVIGDLFESMLKRQAGMKDSGALLPGHGGVLDRIDGLTSTLPLAAFYAYFPMYLSRWLA